MNKLRVISILRIAGIVFVGITVGKHFGADLGIAASWIIWQLQPPAPLSWRQE